MLQAGWLNKQLISAKQLSKIKQSLTEVKNDNSFRVLQSLQQIITFFLGTPNSHGILYHFGNQFTNYQPLQWAAELQKFLQHIGPDSAAFSQLVKRSRDPNTQIIISNQFLPHYIDPHYYEKSKLVNFRVSHSGITVSPLDGFLIVLAYAIYNSEPILAPTTQFQYLFIDDFYTSLSRNPLLILLRKIMDSFTFRDKFYLHKLVHYLRIFFVDQIIIKSEQDQNKTSFSFDNDKTLNNSLDASMMSRGKKIQLKYRIKVHHLHVLYLILRYSPQDIVVDFPKYCQAVTEYYSSLRPDRLCLQAFIRLWIYGVTLKNQSNIENQVINTLENANSTQGWFYIKRYSPTSIYTRESLNIVNLTTAFGIMRLIEKQSYWIANPSYLFAFACFFQLLSLSKTYYFQFANLRKVSISGESKEASLVEKVLRLIVQSFNQSLVDVMSKIKKKNSQSYNQSMNLVQNYEQIIQNYLKQYFKSKNYTSTGQFQVLRPIGNELTRQFRFRQIRQQDLRSTQQNSNIVNLDAFDKVNSQNKHKMVSFYRRNPKNCWQIPIQYNQSTILYYLWYTLAKIIDYVIPGKRQQPRLNIRFLANPINFMGVLVLFLVIYLLFR